MSAAYGFPPHVQSKQVQTIENIKEQGSALTLSILTAADCSEEGDRLETSKRTTVNTDSINSFETSVLFLTAVRKGQERWSGEP